MIKAVFFDLYQTLLTYEPPREIVQAERLKEFGIEAEPETLRWPLVAADEYMYGELARQPFGQRTDAGKIGLLAEYQRTLLHEAGITADEEVVMGLASRMHNTKLRPALFPDVAPALAELKDRGLTLGLISNIDRDISPMLAELGLTAWLDITVTSLDAGCTKPHPDIFREALRQAVVKPEEALYIGDQYQVDVLGSNGAGMKGVLLDRGDYFRDTSDSPRIQSLSQVVEML